jgi:Flp pilus assembly protein TadB
VQRRPAAAAVGGDWRAAGQAQRQSAMHVERRGGARMLAIIGVVLIVLWLIGLAFKVTFWAIHLALIVGLVMIVLNFLTGRRPTALP